MTVLHVITAGLRGQSLNSLAQATDLVVRRSNAQMFEMGHRTKTLPPPPHRVWESLSDPRAVAITRTAKLLLDER